MTAYIHPGRQSDASGCHVLIVAAGAYADAQKPSAQYPVPELPGVARSALDFADFLVRNADDLFRPLASIELLVSEAGGQPVVWQGMPLDPPTMENVKAARRVWTRRLDAATDPMAIACFSGHGAHKGGLQFITDDFGSDGSMDDYIIRLDAFKTGMATQRAPFQMFVYDCCHDLPDWVANRLSAVGGTSLVDDDRSLIRSNIEQIRIDAAMPGRAAFTGSESWLTNVLLEAMKNDGADRIGSDWWITPDQVGKVINAIGKARYGDQWPTATVQLGQLRFDRIVRLSTAPEVDLVLTTDPRHAVPNADLDIVVPGAGTIASDVNQAPCSWRKVQRTAVETRLLGGLYLAQARFNGHPDYSDAELYFMAKPRETHERIDC